MLQPDPSTPTPAGFLLAASIAVGACVGIIEGQPSAGLLIGLVVGLAIAALLWAWDRRR